MALKRPRSASENADVLSSEARQNRVYNNITLSGNSRQHNGDVVNHHTYVQHGDSEQLNADRKVRQILDTLHFPEMDSRRDSIPSAAEYTFAWLLGPEEAEIKDSLRYTWKAKEAREMRAKASKEILQWLEAEHGLFWLCGKAGSGKSTLMKHLQTAITTKAPLYSATSTARSAVLLEHYFWSPGSRMQNSIEAMLRTLLYQLVQARPEVVELCIRQKSSYEGHGSWSEGEMLSVISKASEAGLKMVLLIDGLDECQEDHDLLLKRLMSLLSLRNVKLCVSSRPWQAFKGGFASHASLSLETANWIDLERYTIDQLCQYSRGSPLRFKFDPELTAGAARFVGEVVSRAEGVFLWLFLVLRRLGPRMRFSWSLSDLEPLLSAFPRELKTYLKDHVYARISETWREASETAAVLRFCLAGVHDPEGYEAIMTGEALSDPCFGISKDIEVRDEDHYTERCRTATEFALACGADLVMADRHGAILFSHRSIIEFLNTEEMKLLLQAKTPPHFENPLQLDDMASLWMAKLFRADAMLSNGGPCDDRSQYHLCQVLKSTPEPNPGSTMSDVFRDCDRTVLRWCQLPVRYAAIGSGSLKLSNKLLRLLSYHGLFDSLRVFNDEGLLDRILKAEILTDALKLAEPYTYGMVIENLVGVVADAAAQQTQLRHVSEALAIGVCPNDKTDLVTRKYEYVAVWHVFVMVWWHITYGPGLESYSLDSLLTIHRPQVRSTPSDATVALSSHLWEVAKLLIQHGASIDEILVVWLKDTSFVPSDEDGDEDDDDDDDMKVEDDSEDDDERGIIPHSVPSPELVKDLLKHLVPESHLSELDDVIAARKNSHGPLPCACHENSLGQAYAPTEC